MVGLLVANASKKSKGEYRSRPSQNVAAATESRLSLAAQVKGVDPTFSEPIFLEWATLLYVRANEAHGGPELDSVRPYFTVSGLRDLLKRDSTSAITDVRGVIVGSISLTHARVTQSSWG